jgi:hypothetical protein
MSRFIFEYEYIDDYPWAKQIAIEYNSILEKFRNGNINRLQTIDQLRALIKPETLNEVATDQTVKMDIVVSVGSTVNMLTANIGRPEPSEEK